jgi:pimeloyl-ACP methyl ester carboxylesterase
MDERFLPIEGARIRYRDNGGLGTAVLLTHGIGESLEFWHRQFEAAQLSARLIAWDMPGHGLSDELASAGNLQGLAKAAWQLLDQLGIAQVILVGNSLGAAMSLRMLEQSAARVRGLLLANSAAMGQEVFMPFRLMTLPLLGELMNRPGPAAVERQIQAIVRRPESITPELRKAIERNIMRKGAGAHFLRLLRQQTDWRGQSASVCRHSHEILRSVKVPTVIMHGQADLVLPVRQATQAHQSLPSADLVVIPDCGHTPQLEHPAAFNEQLSRLIALA